MMYCPLIDPAAIFALYGQIKSTIINAKGPADNIIMCVIYFGINDKVYVEKKFEWFSITQIMQKWFYYLSKVLVVYIKMWIAWKRSAARNISLIFPLHTLMHSFMIII